MADEQTCLVGLNGTRMKELVLSLGQPGYRAKQLQHWLYQRLASSFDEMINLPRDFREQLSQAASLDCLVPVHESVSTDGTIKTLFSLDDGRTVESTLMSYSPDHGRDRHTVCLSTQVGCAIGCPFCATGRQGFERDLTPGEIVGQVLYYARRLKKESDTITNLVFMGMGEPLANYDALMQAIEVLNSADCFGLGARNIVISTSGLVPQIKRLAGEKLQFGLAVSLHAATDELRDMLVPVNKRYPLAELMNACREYIGESGRRITFEYSLFQGVNDPLADARRLADLLRGMNCHVNLIQANSIDNPDYLPSSYRNVIAFENELLGLGINATLRQKRGLDIESGCGQLRSRHAARP